LFFYCKRKAYKQKDIWVSRPDCDASIRLEPLQVAGDPGETAGPLGLAAKVGHETVDANLGGQTVRLVDDQRAAGIALRITEFVR
jgi:hypothetical protein